MLDLTRDGSIVQAAALEYGSLVQKEETAFEYEYYQLPPITPAMLTHSVEVRFLASFSSSTYGMLTAAKPELLLLEASLPCFLYPKTESSMCAFYVIICPAASADKAVIGYKG